MPENEKFLDYIRYFFDVAGCYIVPEYGLDAKKSFQAIHFCASADQDSPYIGLIIELEKRQNHHTGWHVRVFTYISEYSNQLHKGLVEYFVVDTLPNLTQLWNQWISVPANWEEWHKSW